MEKKSEDNINQLLNSFEEAEIKLEHAYKKKEHENFLKLKKFLIEVQNKILEEIK